MRFNLKACFFWYLLYYFLIDGGLHQYIVSGEIEPFSIFDTAFSLSSLLIFFLFWLLPYYVFFRFYPTRKWMFIILGIILSFVIGVLVRYGVEQKLFWYLFEITNYPKDISFKKYVFDQYIFASRNMLYPIIYYFIRHSFHSQSKESALTIENQQMQLSVLHSQINPHFLLNSLNNIQSLVYLKSEKATSAIEHLSEILKYKLYLPKDWISIEEEMDMIEKYIALERLRYDYKLDLNIDIEQGLNSKIIPQFLLLPLFENAFKHANFRSEKEPFRLSINKTPKGIVIKSSNAVIGQSKDSVGGIGLENLRKKTWFAV